MINSKEEIVIEVLVRHPDFTNTDLKTYVIKRCDFDKGGDVQVAEAFALHLAGIKNRTRELLEG